ncbi:MAG: hypothetical protein LBR08_02910 [Bacteroidales bacterium]|nr:hypothetical protein [Bacteroidales bacterium]
MNLANAVGCSVRDCTETQNGGGACGATAVETRRAASLHSLLPYRYPRVELRCICGDTHPIPARLNGTTSAAFGAAETPAVWASLQ